MNQVFGESSAIANASHLQVEKPESSGQNGVDRVRTLDLKSEDSTRNSSALH